MVENIGKKYISFEIYLHEKFLNEIHSSYVNKSGNFNFYIFEPILM